MAEQIYWGRLQQSPPPTPIVRNTVDSIRWERCSTNNAAFPAPKPVWYQWAQVLAVVGTLPQPCTFGQQRIMTLCPYTVELT